MSYCRFAEDVFGMELWFIDSMNLTQFFNVGSPVTPWGVVAAPSAVMYPLRVDNENQVFVPSADGHVYSLNDLQCTDLMKSVRSQQQQQALGSKRKSNNAKQQRGKGKGTSYAGQGPAPLAPLSMVEVTAQPKLLRGDESLRTRLYVPIQFASVTAGGARSLQTSSCGIWTLASNISQPFAAPSECLSWRWNICPVASKSAAHDLIDLVSFNLVVTGHATCLRLSHRIAARVLENPYGDGNNWLVVTETSADLNTGSYMGVG